MKTKNDRHDTTSFELACAWAMERKLAGDDLVAFTATELPGGKLWRAVIELRLPDDYQDQPCTVDREFLERIRGDKPLIDPADLPDPLD